ncbi:MAG: MBL fold metallo-hydrolase [Synergistaceae bacterium]|jgi:glyoxylase-like metal-dependent hydrolase (beta-lactamase superfamily II)|nr:MBL fold metallo-hydrolase [Synergistaceae bacterium]
MLKEILPDIYLIEVPLPGNPLKNLNSYFIRGGERNLLVDTGFNRQECRVALTGALDALGADMGRTDIFLTHMHSDHSGLATGIASPTSKIYISAKDHAWMRQVFSPNGWENLNRSLARLGFSDEEVTENRVTNPLWRYSPPLDTIDAAYTAIEDGFSLSPGLYRLRAIETPGHTPGHMCLYAEEQKLLFCGDHIIFDISPNITSWRNERTQNEQLALYLYMESLKRVRELDVKTALSAHRRAMGECRERIDEILRHHRVRLEEVRGIVKKYPRSTVSGIAARMTWVSRSGWESFPVAQKWFAVGEALAHLEYLAAKGDIVQETEGVQLTFI